MTEEQKIEVLQRILQGANVAQVNLGDGYQTFNARGNINDDALRHNDKDNGTQEELCHFIYPGLDNEEAWQVHRQIKDLVKRFPLKDICAFLSQLAEEKKILQPQIPQTAFEELHRMGMPAAETKGFGYDNFCKYYRK